MEQRPANAHSSQPNQVNKNKSKVIAWLGKLSFSGGGHRLKQLPSADVSFSLFDARLFVCLTVGPVARGEGPRVSARPTTHRSSGRGNPCQQNPALGDGN